jgi:hypothetical protein
MNEKTISLETTPTVPAPLVKYGLPLVLFLGVLIALGLVITQTLHKSIPAGQTVSAQTLADEYGIQVNLVAVTAAGGLVDLRMEILDAQKAKLLFQDSSDLPSLRVEGSKNVLTAPEESGKQLLNTLEDGNNAFLMFPNVGHVVKPSTPVTIVFGDVALEPIAAQ